MKKFIAGGLVMMALISLEQDMMGKEKYLHLLSDAWVSPLYTVPIALAVIVIAFCLYHSKTPIN